VALVELKGLGAIFAFFGQFPGEGLDHRGGQPAQQLGGVRAPPHATQNLPAAAKEVLGETQAGEPAVVGRDGFAAAGIGHRVGACRRRNDVHLAVDGDAQPHVVDRLPGAPHAGLQPVVVALDVAQVGFEVPQAVGALVALVANTPRMGELALDLLDWQGLSGRF